VWIQLIHTHHLTTNSQSEPIQCVKIQTNTWTGVSVISPMDSPQAFSRPIRRINRAGASHLSDQWLQQGGGAFSDAAHREAEAAAAPLHDPVVSLVSVESLRQHGPDLQVSHRSVMGNRPPGKSHDHVTSSSGVYLLDDLLTGVSLPVLHDGVGVSAGNKACQRVLARCAVPLRRSGQVHSPEDDRQPVQPDGRISRLSICGLLSQKLKVKQGPSVGVKVVWMRTEGRG